MTWVRRNWSALVTFATVGVDALVLSAAAGLAFFVRFRLGWGTELPYNRFLFFLPVSLSFVVACVLSGLVLGQYTRHLGAGAFDRFIRTGGMITLGVLLALAATFFAFQDRLDFVRLLLVYFWLMSIVAVFVGRTVLYELGQMLSRRGLGVQRVLIVGAGAEGAQVLARMWQEPGRRYRVVGFVDDFATGVPVNGVHAPVLGPVAALPAVIAEHEVDKVVVAIPSLSHDALLTILERTETSLAGVWLLPDLFQLMVSPVTEGAVRGLPLMAVNEVRLKGLSRLIKRTLDLSVAIAGLVLCSIPMLAMALAIRLESRGPVFYVQERVGRDGRRFAMVKYRTMIADAEAGGQTWTVANDPRITRTGRVLRRFVLDELPQLINVIKGDMSLVGPRPERPAYVDKFEVEYQRYLVRHRERSGMTGWAQVNGLRGDSSILERTRYDLHYVENWSLMLDLRILFWTLVVVLRGHGA